MQRARAVSALPLLAAIAYEMRMRRKTRIAITAEIWELAGDLRTEAQRRAMINVLRRVPSIVQLEYRQRIGSKYIAHRGLWWSKAPPRTPRTKVGMRARETGCPDYFLQQSASPPRRRLIKPATAVSVGLISPPMARIDLGKRCDETSGSRYTICAYRHSRLRGGSRLPGAVSFPTSPVAPARPGMRPHR